MASVGMLPNDINENTCGKFVTCVVPAINGCNLKCPFCLIRNRGEANENLLQPNDFERFIRAADQRWPIVALGIQGYEPLLRESLPYTRAVLTTGEALGLPTSLVTNGVSLIEASDFLTRYAPNKIGISLDAASPSIHDRMRGLQGAWAATVRGIEHITHLVAGKTRVAVLSVLTPSKSAHLAAMPKLLSQLGITDWIVTPLLRVGHNQAGGTAANPNRILSGPCIVEGLCRCSWNSSYSR